MVDDQPEEKSPSEEEAPSAAEEGAADEAKAEGAPSEEEASAEASEGEEPAAKADEGGEEDEAQDEIARRVARLGGDDEDDSERVARAEEARLAERRARQKARTGKGKGKKRGLEAAASKRLERIGDKPSTSAKKRAASATAAPAAAEYGDPLLDKTRQLGKWLKANTRVVGWVAGLAVVGLAAFGIRTYLQNKKDADASAALALAVADERGRIGDPDKEEEPDRPKDPTPIFKTIADRREAALAKYREVESKYSGTGAAYLAQLSEGSLLLDKHDADGAIRAYEAVEASPLAKADPEVNGRALEGLGFANELKAEADPANADKWRDAALKNFRALENTDVKGFKELGMYHQARVYEAKGDKDRAKELLKSVYERVTKPGEGHPFPYLQTVAEDRLRTLDPTALPPKETGMMGSSMGGHKQLNEAQLKKIMEQLQKKAQQEQHGQ